MCDGIQLGHITWQGHVSGLLDRAVRAADGQTPAGRRTTGGFPGSIFLVRRDASGALERRRDGWSWRVPGAGRSAACGRQHLLSTAGGFNRQQLEQF